MTVEQEIAQKAAEVEERRKAREAGIRLTTIRIIALGILDLLEMSTTSTEEAMPVDRVNVHYKEESGIWLQVESKTGIYTEDAHDSPEVAEKMSFLNGFSVNEQERRYLQELLGRYRKVLKIENGFAVE